MTSIIRFPYESDRSKESYIEISPIATVDGYGINVSNNFVLTHGVEEEKRELTHREFEFIILQSSLADNENMELYSECIENFYYNNVNSDAGITIFSMLLLEYFPDMISDLDVKLHPKLFTGMKKKKKKMGYSNK